MIRTDKIGGNWGQNLRIRCNSNAVRSRSSPCAPGFACDDGVQQVCGAHNMFSFAKQGVCTVVQPGYYATPEGGTSISLNLVETGIPNIGEFGGSCTCPDGQVYEVGDNNDHCGSLACVGGVEGTCMKVPNRTRIGRRVTCITAPELAKSDQEVCPRGENTTTRDAHIHTHTHTHTHTPRARKRRYTVSVGPLQCVFY